MQKNTIIIELLNGLDILRPVVLKKQAREAELRSLLRRMVSHLETIQRMPHIEPETHQHVVSMLSLLFDAEHGSLLKGLHQSEQQKEELPALQKHNLSRKALIDTAQQDLPAVLHMLRRGFDLLGKPFAESESLHDNFQQFEKHLRAHLQGNNLTRREFNLLISAFQASTRAMSSALEEVGENSPELKAVQGALEKELPPDPQQAQALLREARTNILKAGNKLSAASKQVKQTMAQQVQQMHKLSKRLEQAEAQARNDPLTGLGNRRKLREFFETLNMESNTVFLMIDIDHFKHINDQYGHDAGDTVLKHMGDMLKVATRSTDMAARLGGEEFCIVLPETKLDQGTKLAEKIRSQIEHEVFQTQHGNIDVKVSIGIAERKTDESISKWLKRADEALYRAKQEGRNQVVQSA